MQDAECARMPAADGAAGEGSERDMDGAEHEQAAGRSDEIDAEAAQQPGQGGGEQHREDRY